MRSRRCGQTVPPVPIVMILGIAAAGIFLMKSIGQQHREQRLQLLRSRYQALRSDLASARDELAQRRFQPALDRLVRASATTRDGLTALENELTAAKMGDAVRELRVQFATELDEARQLDGLIRHVRGLVLAEQLRSLPCREPPPPPMPSADPPRPDHTVPVGSGPGSGASPAPDADLGAGIERSIGP